LNAGAIRVLESHLHSNPLRFYLMPAQAPVLFIAGLTHSDDEFCHARGTRPTARRLRPLQVTKNFQNSVCFGALNRLSRNLKSTLFKGSEMDCQSAKSGLALLSIEDVSSSDIREPAVREIEEHLAKCPPCQNEWHVFQQTLLVLSTTPQKLPSAECSRAMWEACSRSIFDKVEAQRVPANVSSASWSLGTWFKSQPVWGWVTLSGAVAVFGAVWFLTPQSDAPVSPNSNATYTFVASGNRPSEVASPFVNHHSAMAFDPFNDHVGSTLVSYSATSQNPTALNSAPPSR